MTFFCQFLAIFSGRACGICHECSKMLENCVFMYPNNDSKPKKVRLGIKVA